MKKLICTIVICLLSYPTFAGIELPAKCEVGLPSLFLKKTIKKSEVNAFVNSGKWGQTNKSQKYWTVYSDRSHNITYDRPSTNGCKYDELSFNEQVRICKIENDMALVYTEEAKGNVYPLVSNLAKCRGWIPMENLLLWNSCPTDESGICNKALTVLNLGEAEKRMDFGKYYQNPVTMDSPQDLFSNMNLYFVMKIADNGMVLLSRECKMEGYTYSVLLGWVNPTSFISWNHRLFLEPNWKPSVVEDLKEKRVSVYRNGREMSHILMAQTNSITNNPTYKYRMEPEMMRFPVLCDHTENNNQYHIIAFLNQEPTYVPGTSSHSQSLTVIPVGQENVDLIPGQGCCNNLEHLQKEPLMTFDGYVDKRDSVTGHSYWQPVILLSIDEFARLMENLLPVMSAETTGNRKPYVDAMKELTRSMIPDITPKEMVEKDVNEIMTLVEALPVKPNAIKGHTLLEICDENMVNDDEFAGIIADFQNKYRRLKKIRENKYDFSFVWNKTMWYWIPVEDLP